jgi:F-type H+-transporting ATPase subunit gamma
VSDTINSLRRKISSAGDLQSVVRTMKTLAASSIGQYESSVQALADYNHAVELGLCAALRDSVPVTTVAKKSIRTNVRAVVFGSDQGLVGQFNDIVGDYAVQALASSAGNLQLWSVGERVRDRLEDSGLPVLAVFEVPHSVQNISKLVGEILIQSEGRSREEEEEEDAELYLFYNRPTSEATYAPTSQRLLPLDERWRHKLVGIDWPTKKLPEVIGDNVKVLRALIREYLFVSLFKACAESLASENASRLAAMQRADKNIDDLLKDLKEKFHRVRQSRIDEELFDVISGFESLKT